MLLIIGILAAIAIGYTTATIQKAKDVQIQADLRQVAIDVQVYAAHYGYPPDAQPGIEPAPEIAFPVEPGRFLDYDRFCVGGTRWVKQMVFRRTIAMIKNIKLQVWEANGRVVLRVENDVPNGSSISADGQSLVNALMNLAEVITCTQQSLLNDDPVWGESVISGGGDDDTSDCQPTSVARRDDPSRITVA